MTVEVRKEWFLGIPLGSKREVFPHPNLPVGPAFTNPRSDWSPMGGVLFVKDSRTATFRIDGGSVSFAGEGIDKARIASPRNLLGVRNAYSYEDDSSMPLRQYFEKTLSGVSRTDPRAQAFYDALVFGNISYNNLEWHTESIPEGFADRFEAECLAKGEQDPEYARAFGWFRQKIDGIDHDKSLILPSLNYLGEVRYGKNGFNYFVECLDGKVEKSGVNK